jgi:hypothetical protein
LFHTGDGASLSLKAQAQVKLYPCNGIGTNFCIVHTPRLQELLPVAAPSTFPLPKLSQASAIPEIYNWLNYYKHQIVFHIVTHPLALSTS